MTDQAEPSESTDPLIGFLRDTSALCPMCRYQLRGVQSNRCPECGHTLRLAIAQPVLAGFGWWLAGVFGLACTSWLLWNILKPSIPKVAESVNNPQLSQLVQRGFVPSSDLPDWPPILLVSAGLLMCLGMMAMIIGSHRRLRAWPLGRQIACGATLLLLPMVLLILVAALT